jgi:Na+-driven multidrug efflux pump
MFGLFIAGAVMVGLGTLLVVGNAHVPDRVRVTSVLTNAFIIFLLVWGALHS